MSIDRLELGEPGTYPWKSAVLYLSGPLKYNQGFLELIDSFDLMFEIECIGEVARMTKCFVCESIILNEFETIAVQISGKIKIADLLEE
jgi:hypothetical protein